MENAVARPRYARRPVQSRHRRKPAKGPGSIQRTIVRQFVICALLLIIVCIVKGVHFSAANEITDKVKYVISYNVELRSVFAYVEKLALEIRDSITPSNSVKSEDADSLKLKMKQVQGAAQTQEIAQTGEPVQTQEATKAQGTVQDDRDSMQASASNTATLSSTMETTIPSMPETSVLSASSGINFSGTGEEGANEAVTKEAATNEIGMLLPVEGMLLSHFGEQSTNTVGVKKAHSGIDIDVGRGGDVLAALDGKVTEAGSSPSYGAYVRILHADGIQTIYANCTTIIAKKGDIVKKGDRIAEISGTGTSVGIHLHFEVWKDGSPVNPLKYVNVPEK